MCSQYDTSITVGIIILFPPCTATFEEGFAVRTSLSSLIIRTGDSITVMWSNQSVIPGIDPASYTVDITLHCLTDPERGVWSEAASLASRVPNTGRAQVTVPNLRNFGISNVSIAVLQVGLGGPVDSGSGVPPTGQVTLPHRLIHLAQIGLRAGIWSAVGFASPLYELRPLCEQWFNPQPSGIGEVLTSQVLPCPPTIDQARRDNRFTMEDPILSFVFYPNTSACFRQVIR